MARKKLAKFEELHSMPNVAEMQDSNAKSKLTDFVEEYQTLILELGCGKGEYTLALARLFEDACFIGVDIQGERLWHGAKQAQKEKLKNVMFLRVGIENLTDYFAPGWVDKIWLTFPDPFHKLGKIKKRLTSPRYLEVYKTILKPRGRVHMKTDDMQLYYYSKDAVKEFGGKIMKDIEDLYEDENLKKIIQVETTYEKKYRQMGRNIYYLSFEL